MQIECAWCKRKIEGTKEHPVSGVDISHGICKDCMQAFAGREGVKLETFIENLPVPVLLLNGRAVVVQANSRARAMLGKAAEQIAGFRGGEVFECAYAALPGGCGETVHCSGCAIRRSVIDTFASGVPLHRVPAVLSRKTRGGKVRADLLISTGKMGGIVLLKIDKAVE